MSSNASANKVILVIGGTGAQGLPVVDALLKPSPDGSLSPYFVRVLTRDPSGIRAQELAKKGVEVVKGMYCVLNVLAAAHTMCLPQDPWTISPAS